MKITIKEPNRSGKQSYNIGQKTRLATMTSVCFTGKNTLVAGHLVGHRLHSIDLDFERSSFKVLDSIETEYGQQPTVSELVDFDGSNHLITSNFDACGGTLYTVDNNHLTFKQDIVLPEGYGQCHGARFYNPNIVCISTNKHFLFFVDINSQQIVSKLKLPYHVKDLAFISETQCVVAIAIRAPSPTKKPTYASGICLVNFDLTKDKYNIVSQSFFTPAAFDSVCYDRVKHRVYFTDQYGNRVIAASIENDRFEILGQINGFNFPHGIAMNEQFIAITNYGDSTIDIIEKQNVKLQPLNGRSLKYRPYTLEDLKGFYYYYQRRLFDKIRAKIRF